MTKHSFKKPDVIIENNIEWVANYLCYIAYTVQSGNYTKWNMPVLPYIVTNPEVVYFPLYPFSRSFWNKLHFAHTQGVACFYPSFCRYEAKYVLKSDNFRTIPKSRENCMIKILNNLITILYDSHLFTVELQKIRRIRLVPTEFGTISSFDYIRPFKHVTDIIITLRIDSEINTLWRSMLNVLLIIQNPSLGFEKKQIRDEIVTVLLTNLQIPNIKYITNTTKITPSLLQDSKKYYKNLGISPTANFSRLNNELYYGYKKLSRRLSHNELILMNVFFDNRNKIVTHVMIANAIWNKESYNKYSEYAISRLVYRLRKKLNLLGIYQPHRIISTYYKIGFIFTN